jgi:hypothetical protein
VVPTILSHYMQYANTPKAFAVIVGALSAFLGYVYRFFGPIFAGLSPPTAPTTTYENLMKIKYKSNVYLVYLQEHDAARSGTRPD